MKKTTTGKAKELSILEAISVVLKKSLNEVFDEDAEQKDSTYLNENLPEFKQISKFLKGLSVMQTKIFLIIFDASFSCNSLADLKTIATSLKLDPLSVLPKIDADIKVLLKKGLIFSSTDSLESLSVSISLESIAYDVLHSVKYHIIKNIPLSEKLSASPDTEKPLTSQAFVSKVGQSLSQMSNEATKHETIIKEVEFYEDIYSSCPFVKEVKKILPILCDRAAFYQLCDFSQVVGQEESLLKFAEWIYPEYDHVLEFNFLQSLLNNTNRLCTESLVTIVKKENLAESSICLADRGIDIFLKEKADVLKFISSDSLKNVKDPSSIVKKELFYPEELTGKIAELSFMLQEKNYQKLIKNLTEARTNTGIACLFYGPPGTGKTETALQIAKETGRKIINVNIEDTRTSWYGESEKLVANIFDEYERITKNEKICPIMLFNEADAVFTSRGQGMHNTADETSNRIVDVFLSKMDTWQGILFATTNNEGYLDKAFYRRFLYKIHFSSPDKESRIAILRNKITWLTEEDANKLSYLNLTGANIDNVLKKLCIAKLNHKLTFSLVESLCKEELQLTGESKQLGFASL